MNRLINLIIQKSNKYVTLIQNFSYLSAIQVFNILFPLITYPYLIRVLGKEIYGLVVFAQAIIGYFVILIGFGFNNSATKEVSIHRDNQEKLNEIVSSVLIIKGILFIFALIILTVLLYFIPQAKGYEPLFFLTMWMCLYDIIFPIWYFQGIEKMKYITYLTIVSRLTFLTLIFVFIHSPEDYLFIPILNGIGALIVGISSLLIVFGKYRVKFSLQPYKCLKHYFIDSLPIFVSNVSVSLYVSTNKIIIGAFLGMTEVAYFDLAEKLTSILKTPIQIIGQTLYPKLIITKNKNLLIKSFYLTFILALLILVIGILASKSIISIIGGKEMIYSIPIFRILLISIIPISISLYFGILTLLPRGYNKDYLKIRIYTFIIYTFIIAILFVFKLITLYTMAILAVAIEMITAIIAIALCNKRKINFLKNIYI